MKYVFHPDALTEYAAAVQYYSEPPPTWISDQEGKIKAIRV